MPYGTRRRGVATGPALGPRTISGRSLSADPVESAGRRPDIWQHRTIKPAELAGGAVVTWDLPALCERIKVMERDGAVIRVRFGNDPVTASNYDLIHPGKAELDTSTPQFTRVTLLASLNPTNDVDVWALAGRYTTAPV